MTGNATFRHTNTAVLSVSGLEAPIAVTSAELDELLAPTLERLDMRPGLLQQVAGIFERRWWPRDVSFTDAAAMAGDKALSESGIDASQIGLLINTSVCKEQLEPSAAVAVHHALGLPTQALNFDLANACLGFVNGMHFAATMIDAGHLDYAMIVDGEGSRITQEATLARLQRPTTTAEDFFAEFATLTLGSGAAAMVLGPADAHHGGHRIVGGVARAGTEHHNLCVGNLTHMRTDTKRLLIAGLDLMQAAWEDARADYDWSDMDRYILHQVSSVHTDSFLERLGIDPARVPLTFPHLGNVGPASLPITLASQSDSLRGGDRVLCMGVGSGLNTAFTEIIW